MTIDRRVARTRAALYDALINLVRQKDYDLITVEEILNLANVGRSTFYAHFASKDDLLETSLERLRQILIAAREEAYPGGTGWRPESGSLSLALFQHMAEHADIQLALIGGRGAAIVQHAINDVLASLLRDALPASQASGFSRDLAIRHIVATFNTVLRWWLEDRSRMSAAEAETCFRELLLRGLPEEVSGSLHASGSLAPPQPC